MKKKLALLCGAGGFIGSHLATRLKSENYVVVGVDLKYPEFSKSDADTFIQGDLRDQKLCRSIFEDFQFNEVYQLAADMGGAGYIFTGDHDAHVMHNSAQINLNIAELSRHQKNIKLFYSSSACMYPEYNQQDPLNPKCSEDSAYPAAPDSEYGWEKLFSERLYLAYARNHGLNLRIARYHNIYGPLGAWQGGREKAPAALCRKIAQADNPGNIDIWGDGEQTRSFMYIDDCIEATRRLMQSDFKAPVNIGSEEMVSINQLASLISDLANKDIQFNHIEGPLGVRGRNSDNALFEQNIGWKPQFSLQQGLQKTYQWIESQVKQAI